MKATDVLWAHGMRRPIDALVRLARSNVTRQQLHRAVLILWAIAISVICGHLLVRHLVPLPTPSHLAPGFVAFRSPKPGEIIVFHVLLAGCRCSEQIARRLVMRPRPTQVEEHLVLVDDDALTLERRFARTSFIIHHVSTRDLASTFHVSGVPLLLVVSGDGEVRYSGGYTERKQGLIPRDIDIIDAVARGETPDPLPLFGCATAEELRRTHNPWWLP